MHVHKVVSLGMKGVGRSALEKRALEECHRVMHFYHSPISLQGHHSENQKVFILLPDKLKSIFLMTAVTATRLNCRTCLFCTKQERNTLQSNITLCRLCSRSLITIPFFFLQGSSNRHLPSLPLLASSSFNAVQLIPRNNLS